MKRAVLAASIFLALAACSSPADPPPPIAPPWATAPRPAPIVTPRDSCGAADLQYLVGQSRTEIPVPVRPNLQRVACTTCPVTQDYSPSRLNFFFEAQTGVIREVRCG